MARNTRNSQTIRVDNGFADLLENFRKELEKIEQQMITIPQVTRWLTLELKLTPISPGGKQFAGKGRKKQGKSRDFNCMFIGLRNLKG